MIQTVAVGRNDDDPDFVVEVVGEVILVLARNRRGLIAERWRVLARVLWPVAS